ncbi:MAG TPA: MFS transporter, partial [Cyclobacteriaceae bacterium]|nr:MFS transporter [Cyclobacteriaceae bacterium]
LAIVSLLLVKIPSPPRGEQQPDHVIQEIILGMQEVSRQKGLKLLFLFSILSMLCIMPVSVLFPLMTLDHFSGNIFQASLIEIAWGVGMLLGGVILGAYRRPVNKIVLINLMYLVLGLSLVGSGLLPPSGFTFFVILTIFGGLSGAIYTASFNTVLQETVNPAMLGRVFSMYMSISMLPSLLGLAGIGFFADTVGLTRTFVILGAVIFLLGLISFSVPSIMAMGQKKRVMNFEL